MTLTTRLLGLAFASADTLVEVDPKGVVAFAIGAGAVAAMSAGLTHGFRRGYLTTLGLVLGIWTQVVVVGIGLGALVATSAMAFSTLAAAEPATRTRGQHQR